MHAHRQRRLILAASGLALGIVFNLALGMGVAFAHGKAELTVSPTVVPAGGEIKVEAKGVEAGEQFTITLEGMSYRAVLGIVMAGDDEDFHQDFTIPADAPAGIYQVKADNGQGEVLTAEVTVEATSESLTRGEQIKPSAEPMALDRRKSAGQIATVIAGIFVAAALGVLLIRVR